MSRPYSLSARVASIAAVLFGVTYFVTVASVNVPRDAADDALVSWWSTDANVTAGLVSLAFAVCTAVLFSLVTNHVLLLAGERAPHAAAFARSMSSAFTSTLLVAAALRGVVGHLVQVQGEALPGVDVLRYSTALNYTLIGMVVPVTFALTVGALGVVLLRAETLPRWLARLSLGCAGLILAAAAVTFGAHTIPVAILWAMCAAVAIWRRGVPVPADAGDASVEVRAAG